MVLDGVILADAPAPPAQGLHRHGPRNYNNFPCFYMACDLEKLGHIYYPNCLERGLSTLLLRALAVGRRHLSESIGVTLDINQGELMNRFDIDRYFFF